MRLQFPFCKAQTYSGFTLLEVMVALAVLSIILFIGIPGFNSLFESARERSATSTLVTSVNLARSEAVTRGTFTRVCVTSACAQGSNEIRVEVEAGGNRELLRAWESENHVAYQNGNADGLSVRFSPLGLAVDASDDQLRSGLEVQILDTAQASPRKLSSYCISVTGSISAGGCN